MNYIDDKNLWPTRLIHGEDSLSRGDFLIVLDSSEEEGEYDLLLPPGITDLVFKFGQSQATLTGESVWTLVPDGADVVDAAVGSLGAAAKSIVFKNGTWYLIA